MMFTQFLSYDTSYIYVGFRSAAARVQTFLTQLLTLDLIQKLSVRIFVDYLVVAIHRWPH